jgi:hypothetical protein
MMAEFEQIVGCAYCTHWHQGTATCDAFPEGIPSVILGGQLPHTTPIEGDHGIQFEPTEKWDGYLVLRSAQSE